MKPIRNSREHGRLVERDERCRKAKCPNYQGPATGKADNRNPDCWACSGPVVWPDSQGQIRGSTRSCTSCKMNGMGLPVCWACCPGPNENFATDGQNIVSIDVMAESSGFAEMRVKDDGIRKSEIERLIGEIDGESEDEPEWRGLLVAVASRIIRMTGSEIKDFIKAWNLGKYDVVTEMINISWRVLQLSRPAIDQMIQRLNEMTENQWNVARLTLLGKSQAEISRLMRFTSRQVANNTMSRLRKNGWFF